MSRARHFVFASPARAKPTARLQAVPEAQVLAIRLVEEVDVDPPADATAILGVRVGNLDVSPTVALDFLLGTVGLERVATLVLAVEVPAQCAQDDKVADDCHDADGPWDEVAGLVLLAPRLRAKELAEGVADEEDTVRREALESKTCQRQCLFV